MTDAAVKLKICGITRYEDARLALDLGAWALGLIFHPPSPRAIDPDRARELVGRLPARTRTIGVFVDRPVGEVTETVRHVGLAGVQLHGRESPAEVAAVGADLVIKALRVGEKFTAGEMDPYACDLILLDTYRRGLPGGTGETFDWNVAREASQKRPVLLAGGIGPENAAAALAAVRPFGLDVSSGVESSPGRKDPGRLRRLFAAVEGAGGR